MKKLLKYFPLSLSTKEPRSLLVTLLIYILMPIIFILISSLFSKVMVLGAIMYLISSLFSFYCIIGIIITFFKFFKVIK